MAVAIRGWRGIGRVRAVPTGVKLLVRCQSETVDHKTSTPAPEGHSEDPTKRLETDVHSQQTNRHSMTFAEYRKVRKSMKMRSRIAGIPIGFGGILLSSAISIHLNPRMFEMTPEEITPILGMDPMMVAALCGLGTGVMGYFIGGAVFTATWKLIARDQSRQLEERDRDFLKLLQKYRFSEVNKYEDDYYGDKIMTLSDFRQWARQQQKRREMMEAQDAATAATKKT